MKFLICIIIFFRITLITGQQIIDVKLLKKFSLSTENFIGLDKFGDFYYINQNVLKKENDAQSWAFKDYNLGEIYQVDITNPLQILVFYKDFQTILVLDNQLNEIRRLSINAEQNYFIKNIGLSIQNKIWFYDEKFQKFGLYDMQNKHWQAFPYILKNIPVLFFSTLNQFYWTDNQNTLFSINIFGQVNKVFVFENNDESLSVDEKFIYFKRDDKYFQMDLKNNQSNEIKIPEENHDYIQFKSQKMLIFTNKQISLYQLNP